MIELLNIRKHYGLSQSNMAQLLGTSVSTIKMAEQGLRMLPLISAAPFARLLQHYIHPPAPEKEETVNRSSIAPMTATGELNSYIRNTFTLVRQLERQLLAMQTTYKQALNRQGLLNFLKADLPVAEAGDNWLGLLVTATQRQQAANELKAQAVLQWKIDIHQYGLGKALELEQQLDAMRS